MTKTFYITKHALTQGIRIVGSGTDIEASVGSDDVLSTNDKDSWYSNYCHGEGREWHRSMEAAISKSEETSQDKVSLHGDFET